MKKQKSIRRTRVVSIGPLAVGGRNPVRIKGMLKTPVADSTGLIREAKALEKEGAEAIRMAVKEEKDAALAARLKNKISVPLVADIHFNYRLALAAIAAGFDQIRLNPLNISKPVEIRQIIREARTAGISLRVGINSGGFREENARPDILAKKMVSVATAYIKRIERMGFFDIMVSLKTSNIASTIAANRLLSQRFDYPLHLGVTATGPFIEGIVKSALGIGILLHENIGDVIRVSLTGPSFWEIRVAKLMLQFLGQRDFFCEIISCPTCSRCEVDLPRMVEQFRKLTVSGKNLPLPCRVALMGCVVNGPGEASQADVGLAFGAKRAAIFKKGKIVGWTNEAKALDDLARIMEEMHGSKGD